MPKRDGKRKSRKQRKTQHYRLKYYLIITDTEKTEENYFNGLKDSLPKDIKNKISIKVAKAKTPQGLINEAGNIVSLNTQISDVWLVFDRDEVKDFNKIVERAQKKKYKVGWSNPCIEIWFYAYFGEMPKKQDSVQCVRDFALKYKQYINQEYSKSDSDLYSKLIKFGNEENAIKIAKERLIESQKLKCKPSEMFGTTKVFELVEEIRKTK